MHPITQPAHRQKTGAKILSNPGERETCRILLMFSMISPPRSPWPSTRLCSNPICATLADTAANLTRFCGYARLGRSHRRRP